MAIPSFEGRRTHDGAFTAEFTPEEMEAIRQAEIEHGYTGEPRPVARWAPLVELGIAELLRAAPAADQAIASRIRTFRERVQANNEQIRAEQRARREAERRRRIAQRIPEERMNRTPIFGRGFLGYAAIVLLLVGDGLIGKALVSRIRDSSEPLMPRDSYTEKQPTSAIIEEAPAIDVEGPMSFVTPMSAIESDLNALPLRPVLLDDTTEVQAPDRLTPPAPVPLNVDSPPILRRLPSVTAEQGVPQTDYQGLDGTSAGTKPLRVAYDGREPDRQERRRRPSRLRRVFGSIGLGFVEVANLPFEIMESEP